MTDRTRQLLKLTLKVTVTGSLLLWMFGRVDFGELSITIKSARWEFLAAVWLMCLINILIRSAKMQFILKKQACEVRLKTLIVASLITFLYSMIMPGVLSTGIKWYILKKDTGKGATVFSGMIYNELVEMAVSIAIGVVALMISNPFGHILPRGVCWILLAAIIFVSMLLSSRRVSTKIVKVFSPVLKIFPVMVRQKIEDILAQTDSLQKAGAKFHLTVAFVTMLANALGGIAIYYFSAKAANITVPASVFVWLWAIIYILSKLPISIANLGVREITLVGMLAYYGVETAEALLMSMIIFSGTLFLAVVGGVLHLSWMFKKSNSV